VTINSRGSLISKTGFLVFIFFYGVFFTKFILISEADVIERKEEIEPDNFFSHSLTGDWGGFRSDLLKRGVALELEYYGDTLAIVSGGLNQKTNFSGLLAFGLHVDTDKLAGWKDSQFFFSALVIHGGNPTDDVGSVHSVSNIEALDSIKALEAWFEKNFFENRLSLLGGLYALDGEFDVQETGSIFLNGGFGTGLDLSETGLNGPSIFPSSALGARIKIQLNNDIYVQGVVLDGVAGDPSDTSRTKIILDKDDGVLVATETGYHRRGDSHENLVKIGVGGWVYPSDFDDLVEVDGAGNPVRRSGTYGVYGFAEAQVYAEGRHSMDQGLWIFFRLGYADEDVNQFQYYFRGGLAYTGLVPGRDEDVMGLGVSMAFNGDKFKTAIRNSGEQVDDAEIVIEGTYLIQLLPWLSIQPDFQYVINPGTDPNIDNSFLVGARFVVIF